MNRFWTAVAVLLSVFAAGIAVWALGEAREARDARSIAGSTPAPGRAETFEARLARLEERARESREAPRATGTAPVPGPSGPAPDAPSPEEAVRALVRQTVKEELETRWEEKTPPRPDGRKPPLSQFAAELELDEGQREGVQRAVVRGQEEVIGLLRTASPGGRVPLDDLMNALLEKPERVQERMIEVFGMLATEKVPGGTETYAERIEGVKKATSESFRRSFTEEQFRAYEKTGQDPLEIQVPDSPWIQVLQEAWKRTR